MNTTPEPLRKVASDIPRDLETVITKAIAPNALGRYQSTAEFGADLSRFVEGKPVLARRASIVEVAARWCVRNRFQAAFLSLLSVLLLTLAIGGPLVAVHQARIAREQAAVAEKQRQELYDQHMARAHEHIEYGEIKQAADILRRYLPGNGNRTDYRSFEWYEMLYRCRRRLEAVTIPMGFPCKALAVSPSGDIAVRTFFEGPVVFDGVTYQRKWTTNDAEEDERHNGNVTGIAYTADGRYVLSVGIDMTLRVWTAAAGQHVHTEELTHEPISIAASASGILAVGTNYSRDSGFPRNNPVPVLLYQLRETPAGSPHQITLEKVGELTLWLQS